MGVLEGGGMMGLHNKAGTPVAIMEANEDGGAMGIHNKDGNTVAIIGASEDDDGAIVVYNKYKEVIGHLP